MKKLFVVEAMSTFHVKYAVLADKEPNKAALQEMIDQNDLVELEQFFLGEKLTGVTPASPKQKISILNEQEKINELPEAVDVREDTND